MNFKILNEGEIISKYTERSFPLYFIIPLFCINYVIILFILTILIITYFPNFEPPTRSTPILLILIIYPIKFLTYSIWFLATPSNNLGVIFFKNYLFVKPFEGNKEIEVPFKMIKRFLLNENNRTVIVEYKEEYVFEVLIDEKNSKFLISETPIEDRKKIILRPNGNLFPQAKQGVYDLNKFSFNLIEKSKVKNIAIVNELNQIIHQHNT